MQLIVQPMVDPGDDKEEGWGEFDCEINDRRVSYMDGLVKAGNKFVKAVWGGGDSEEPLYEHEFVEKVPKRKKRVCKTNVNEGPALKQRRLSRYFSRQSSGQGGKLEEVEAKVENLTKIVLSLRKMVVEQGKLLRGRRGGGSGRFSGSRLFSVRTLKRKEVGTGKKKLFDEKEVEDALGEDCTNQVKLGGRYFL